MEATKLCCSTLPFRLNDRSKETPKTAKQLNRLFPNKVTIQIPQDETLLSDWKMQLDRDIETMKSRISYGLNILLGLPNENKSLKKSLKDVVTENEFEKRILSVVIPPGDIGVTFDRHCNDVLEDAPAEKFIPTSHRRYFGVDVCKSWL